jgi:murein L,D-transpeptidase YcbB/YkuD
MTADEYNTSTKFGMSYREILPIQRRLMFLGYPCTDNGQWDKVTEDSINRFKIRNGLKGDGIPTRETLELLARRAGA